MADGEGASGAAPLYEPLLGGGLGFVLGGEGADAAGPAGDWERRCDAPTALRIAIGDDGEPQAPPEAHDTVRATRVRACAWVAHAQRAGSLTAPAPPGCCGGREPQAAAAHARRRGA